MYKKMMLLFCFIQFFSFCLKSEDTYWDAKLVRSYVHNSELQRRWAWAFLASKIKQLKGDERVLDIGCGDGKITADFSHFIPQGTILGIDPSLSMLEWAQKQFCLLEYPNLTFQIGGFLEYAITGTFDIIFSNCALQHCSNQAQAFSNLAKLLKPNGKLWIMIPAIDNEAWKQARKTIQASPQWVNYWETVTPRSFFTIQECTVLLEKANLTVQRIEKIQTNDPFIDREEFLNFLLGTLTPAVSSEYEIQFYNELIDEYLRLLPEAMDSNGVIEARFGRIEIEASNEGKASQI